MRVLPRPRAPPAHLLAVHAFGDFPRRFEIVELASFRFGVVHERRCSWCHKVRKLSIALSPRVLSTRQDFDRPCLIAVDGHRLVGPGGWETVQQKFCCVPAHLPPRMMQRSLQQERLLRYLCDSHRSLGSAGLLLVIWASPHGLESNLGHELVPCLVFFTPLARSVQDQQRCEFVSHVLKLGKRPLKYNPFFDCL